jgi:YesN/AraC family two-component response regulator
MVEKVKILIIDDEEIVLIGVQKILSHDIHFDFIIDFAYSAEEGLEKSFSTDYDIIISDIVLPEMNGMELLQKLMDKNITTQIIMFTGYATMKTALLSLKMGAFDFIAKPFTSDELCSSLHRALNTEFKRIDNKDNRIIDKNIIKPNYVYTIPGKAWAKIQEDHSILIGIEIEFLESIGEIKELEMVTEREQIFQGQGFGKITAKNNIVHTMPSPLSGSVLTVNNKIIDNIQHIYDFPRFEGWLLHIEPTEIEKEVFNLILLK